MKIFHTYQEDTKNFYLALKHILAIVFYGFFLLKQHLALGLSLFIDLTLTPLPLPEKINLKKLLTWIGFYKSLSVF